MNILKSFNSLLCTCSKIGNKFKILTKLKKNNYSINKMNIGTGTQEVNKNT